MLIIIISFGFSCHSLFSKDKRFPPDALTLVGFADDVDDLSGLQAELVGLLGDVLLHALHLRTVCHPQTHIKL